MDLSLYSSMNLVVKAIRKPGFWFILVLLVLISLPYYSEAFKHPAFLRDLMSDLRLERHAFERILYLAPIIWAGFIFGWQGAVITSIAALALMLPRVFFISAFPRDSIFETAAVFILGNVIAVSFEALSKARERRAQLEKAQKELQAYVQVIRENERRLAALHQISSTVSQSLDLGEVLNSAIDNAMDVMKVDVGWIFLFDEGTRELTLTAYRGAPEEFARGVDKLKLGEGFSGKVAESGQPMLISDASSDPRLAREVVVQQHLRTTLVVPLSSKGKVSGTLCVAMRSLRNFKKEEIELLTAIGNQISIAIENARLYQRQQEGAEELRESEQRYRQLFENAYDAIWLHDLNDNIIAANEACADLTGYGLDELRTIKAYNIFAEDSRAIVKNGEVPLTRGEAVSHLAEAKIVRKDGSEAFVQLSTSPVSAGEKIVGFQHIARDITEQKRMQENQRFYLQQATRAQEEERKRISRELHDETIQSLVALSRKLDALASTREGLPEKVRSSIEELWQQTNGIMKEVRRLSQDLRPAALDRLGLLPALEWLAADTSQYSGIETKVKVTGTERRFPEEVELVLFRITQEALRNVWRHSGATRADITVAFDQEMTRIMVSDNGRGFTIPGAIGDLARYGKLGLAGMQERARLVGGSLKVRSEPGKGTTVTIEMPQNSKS
jgi:PAS domain S-box-containing protein